MRGAISAKELRLLLLDWDFRRLDTDLNAIQQGFEAGHILERVLSESFGSFTEPFDPKTERLFGLWLEEFPESYAAHLARGMYLAHQSMRLPEGDLRKDRLMQAKIDLEVSCLLSPKPLLSYCHMIVADAQTEPYSDEVAAGYYHKAIYLYPKSFEARRYRLFSLRPALSGSLQTMREFVSDANLAHLSVYPQQKLQNLQLIYEAQWYIDSSQEYLKALQTLARALENDPSAEVLAHRAEVFARMGRFPESQQDLRLAQAKGLENDESRAAFAMACLRLGERMLGTSKPHDAIGVLENGLSLWPDYAPLKALLGRALKLQKPGDPRAHSLLQDAAQAGDTDAQRWLTV